MRSLWALFLYFPEAPIACSCSSPVAPLSVAAWAYSWIFQEGIFPEAQSCFNSWCSAAGPSEATPEADYDAAVVSAFSFFRIPDPPKLLDDLWSIELWLSASPPWGLLPSATRCLRLRLFGFMGDRGPYLGSLSQALGLALALLPEPGSRKTDRGAYGVHMYICIYRWGVHI